MHRAKQWVTGCAVLFALLGGALLASACGRRNPESPAFDAVTLRFVATVAGAPFDCAQSYSGLGTSAATWRPVDFRFYVSRPRLLDAAGQAQPLEMVADGAWQNPNVALLDFENGQGLCSNGTAPTRDRVVARLAAGKGPFVGLQFELGVPFADNHQDVSTAPAPLDQAALFWNWNAGYKFLTVDGKVDAGLSHSVHLGSTGCTPDAAIRVSACSAANLATITLPRFDPATQAIEVDLARLLANSDLRQPSTAMKPADIGRQQQAMDMGSGCMSQPGNPGCAPIFAALGLPFGGVPGGSQQVFVAVPAALP